MDVPDGMDVNVVENSDNTVHITMPTAPAGAMNLSDEELAGAAGGCDGISNSVSHLDNPGGFCLSCTCGKDVGGSPSSGTC